MSLIYKNLMGQDDQLTGDDGDEALARLSDKVFAMKEITDARLAAAQENTKTGDTPPEQVGVPQVAIQNQDAGQVGNATNNTVSNSDSSAPMGLIAKAIPIPISGLNGAPADDTEATVNTVKKNDNGLLKIGSRVYGPENSFAGLALMKQANPDLPYDTNGNPVLVPGRVIQTPPLPTDLAVLGQLDRMGRNMTSGIGRATIDANTPIDFKNYKSPGQPGLFPSDDALLAMTQNIPKRNQLFGTAATNQTPPGSSQDNSTIDTLGEVNNGVSLLGSAVDLTKRFGKIPSKIGIGAGALGLAGDIYAIQSAKPEDRASEEGHFLADAIAYGAGFVLPVPALAYSAADFAVQNILPPHISPTGEVTKGWTGALNYYVDGANVLNQDAASNPMPFLMENKKKK